MPTDPLVAAWLAYLETTQRHGVATRKAYANDMALLKAQHPQSCLDTLQHTDIRHSLAQLKAQGYNPRSLGRTLSAWRSFYQWRLTLKKISENPVQDIRAPKVPRPLPRALSVDQMQGLLDSAQHHAMHKPVALRDQAMFELFYSCGLRLAELVSLDHKYVREPGYESVSWLDMSQAQVVVRGKGQKERLLPVGSKAMDALSVWLGLRNQWPQHATPEAKAALFLGTRGGRIAPRIVHEQLKRMAYQANLPVHLHPHVLRHSFASHLLQSSQDIRAVQELLGHSTIRTTQIYTGLDFQHLAKVYDQAHPRATRRKNSE